MGHRALLRYAHSLCRPTSGQQQRAATSCETNTAARRCRGVQCIESLLTRSAVLWRCVSYAAVCERCVGAASFPYLTVVDLRTLKKRRSFGPALHQQAAAACAARPFQSLVSLCFSSDSKHILCLSAGPDACLLEWQWQKEQLTASGLLRASDGGGASTASLPYVARSASYCPTDNSVVCVTGDGVLQLLSVDWDTGAIADIPPSSAAARSAAVESEEAATAAVADSEADSACDDVDVAALDVSCHAWLSESRVLLATRTGQLLIAHNGRITGHTSTASVQLTSGTPVRGTARAATSTAVGVHAAETAEQRPSGRPTTDRHATAQRAYPKRCTSPLIPSSPSLPSACCRPVRVRCAVQ